MKALCALAALSLGLAIEPAAAQEPGDPIAQRIEAVEQSLGFMESRLMRGLNDLQWFHRLGDIARIDKVRYTGPPNPGTNKPGGTNDVIISAHTFLPKKRARHYPLIVFAHGEIHGNVTTDEEAVIVRELVEQGYAVIAPDYRGSSGYGGDFWRQIDYGGLEVEDVFAGRNWMTENRPEVDSKRVGIIGWSHGGLVALMNAFKYSNAYQAVYAGVPVTDLVTRLSYRDTDYEKLFSAPFHIGQSVAENQEEYRRRSPIAHAAKLRIPLLIHGNTNDEDVRVIEIERMLEALRAAGRPFESRIYTNAPGGHHFNRLDTKLARESRADVYRFLAKHLKPPWPPI
ncbi:MAG: alpha/beta fold hydrolase [Verrucomicrobia subdivision 3 bacterium]|nr:alpha/beta fold hydrolase [Limisphaerales bacterium]